MSRARVLLWPVIMCSLFALPNSAEPGPSRAAEAWAATVFAYRTVQAQELKLDVYFPNVQDIRKTRPAVIAVHGGGWSSGSRSGLVAEANLFARHGYIVVVPDYRPSATTTFPGALQDITAAYAWCLDHAAELHIDRSRIGVFGASAGGQLALLLALAGQDAELARVAGLPTGAPAIRVACSWFGPTDLLVTGSDAKGVSSNTRKLVFQYMGGPPSKQQRMYQLASPAYHVHPGAPPVLLVHGEADDVVPVSQSEILIRTLTKERVPNKFVRVKRAGHWFAKGWLGLRSISPSRSEIDAATVAFFDKVMK